jgi:hypothetical protein
MASTEEVVAASRLSLDLVEVLAELGFRQVATKVSVEKSPEDGSLRVVLKLSQDDARELFGLLRKGQFDEQQSARGE